MSLFSFGFGPTPKIFQACVLIFLGGGIPTDGGFVEKSEAAASTLSLAAAAAYFTTLGPHGPQELHGSESISIPLYSHGDMQFSNHYSGLVFCQLYLQHISK